MPLQTPRDLYLHDLTAIYSVEKDLLKVLPQLAGEVESDSLKHALLHHRQQTEKQIENLEKCFEEVGESPQTTTVHALEGLKKDHESFLEKEPAKEVLTQFDAAAAAKTETLEIASYHGLVEKANLLELKESKKLLQQNMMQEREMLFTLQEISKSLGDIAKAKGQ